MPLVWGAKLTNQKGNSSLVVATALSDPSRGHLSGVEIKNIDFLPRNIKEIPTQNGPYSILFNSKIKVLGFPGGAVVENLPANAGDTGSSPGLGRSHILRSN